jgi:hypothetical protein
MIDKDLDPTKKSYEPINILKVSAMAEMIKHDREEPSLDDIGVDANGFESNKPLLKFEETQ